MLRPRRSGSARGRTGRRARGPSGPRGAAASPRTHRAGNSRSPANHDAIMHMFACQRAVREQKAGPDVVRFKERVVLEKALDGLARRQIGQHVLHGDPHVADDRLAAENVGAHGNAVQQFVFSNQGSLLGSRRSASRTDDKQRYSRTLGHRRDAQRWRVFECTGMLWDPIRGRANRPRTWMGRSARTCFEVIQKVRHDATHRRVRQWELAGGGFQAHRVPSNAVRSVRAALRGRSWGRSAGRASVRLSALSFSGEGG